MRQYKRVAVLAESALRLAAIREAVETGRCGLVIATLYAQQRLAQVGWKMRFWSWVDREEEFA